MFGVADGDLEAFKSYQAAPVWICLQASILSLHDEGLSFLQDLLHQMVSSVQIVDDKNCAFHLANAYQTCHLLLKHHLL